MTTLFRRLSDFIRGLTSLALVLALLVGIPAALVILVGFPLPTEVPSVDLVRAHVEDGDVPDLFLIKTLALVVWFVWFQLAVATLVELVGLARGRMAGRAPVLPGIQTFVGKLVASTVLVVSAFAPAKPALVAPIAAPVLAVDDVFDLGGADGLARSTAEMPRVGGRAASAARDASADAAPDGAGPVGGAAASGPSSRALADGIYTTRGGDNWWDVAERLLGDGLRWSELRSLNDGRTMPTGDVVTGQTEAMRAGWPLVVPADADPSQLDPEPVGDRAGSTVAQALRPQMLVYEGPTGATTGVGPAYQVVEGDNLWDIADRHLGDPFRWPEIFEASTGLTQPFGQRITDPNLIWPDSIVLLPPDAVDVPAADPELVREVLGHGLEGPAPVPPVAPAPPSPPSIPEAGPALEPDDLHRMAERASERAAASTETGAEPPMPVVDGAGSASTPVEVPPPDPDGPPDGPTGPAGLGSPAGLAIGSGALLVATGLLGLLRRARRLRLSETGARSVPQPPPVALAEIETVLRQRSDGLAAEQLLRAVASLGHGVARADEPWPMPEAVRVTGHRIEAVVHDGGGDLPTPWREAPVDGGVLPPGRRAVIADLADLRELADNEQEVLERERIDGEPAETRRGEPAGGPGGVPVAPSLVTVGAGLLLNLEAVGVLAVEGDPEIVAGLARSIVHELATGIGPAPPTGRVEVLVSDRLGGFELHPAVRSGPVDRLVVEAEPWLQETELALAASGAATPFGLRLAASTGPGPAAMVVVASGSDLDRRPGLVALIERARDRRIPLAVAVIGEPADPSLRPSMTVTAEDGHLHLDPLGLAARPPDLDLDLIVGVEALIDHARRAPIIPRPEPWWAAAEADHRVERAEPGPLYPPKVAVDDDPASLPTEETPEHEIVTEVPVEEEEVTDRSEGDDTGLLVRVLGPVEIEGGPVGLPDLPDLQRSILAFLALAGPSTIDQIAEAVAPTGPREAVDGAIADLGRRLGPLFPTSGDGRHRVRSTITDLGSARRWIAQAGGLSDDRARNLLHLALSEVRGRPFADVGDRHWQWVEDHRLAIGTQASSLLIDACFDLCDSAYRVDDLHLALWACEVASMVDPLQETAVTRQAQLLTVLDRPDDAVRVVEAWEIVFAAEIGRPAPRGPRSALARHDDEPRPDGPDGRDRAPGEVVSHVG